jgi:hypothetical protein
MKLQETIGKHVSIYNRIAFEVDNRVESIEKTLSKVEVPP